MEKNNDQLYLIRGLLLTNNEYKHNYMKGNIFDKTHTDDDLVVKLNRSR